MGGVIVRKHIHDAFMHGARPTRSSCSTAIPTRRIRWPAPRRSRRSNSTATSDLFERASELGAVLGRALHIAARPPNVLDVRNIGLVGAVELAATPDGEPARAAIDAMERASMTRA